MNYDKYRQVQLHNGAVFQDYVSDILEDRLHLFTRMYTSRHMQMSVGESRCGVEVKFDGRFRETGNLYFEIAEKSSPDMPEYTPSGIYRPDNTLLLTIGDFDTVFLFSPKLLRQWHKQGIFEEKQTPTSQGFVLSTEQAGHYCLEILDNLDHPHKQELINSLKRLDKK